MKKIITAALAIILSISTLVSFQPTPMANASTESIIKYDTSAVYDDLSKNEDFNVLVYPYNQYGKTSMIDLVEYCYSVTNPGNYGLYIYIYNPTNANFNTLDGAKITLSTDGKSYKKYNLNFCSKSTGNYDNLFYKFKIELPSGFINLVNSNGRQYAVSELEFKNFGENDFKASKVAKRYTYSGYSTGYGGATEDTLKKQVCDIETIDLTPKSTYYRIPQTTTESTQIDSVYFAIDNEIIEKYGIVYAIAAECYEYITAPVIVVENTDIYLSFLKNVGIDVFDEEFSSEYFFNTGYTVDTTINGMFTKYPALTNDDTQNPITKLVNLFYKSNANSDIVTSEELKTWWSWYTEKFGEGDIYGGYNNDLFKSDSKGYNPINLTAEDLYSIDGFEMGNAFETWWTQLWSGFKFDETNKIISPIKAISSADMLSDDLICKSLYIAENDKSEFINYYNTATENDETVVLFRFGVSNYTACDIEIKKGAQTVHYDGEYRQQTVYLGYDTLSITFKNNDVFTTLGVVQSPIDVIADLEASNEVEFSGANDWPDWVKWVIGVAILILIIVLIYPFLPYIAKFLLWLVLLPWKCIKAIAEKNKKRKERKRNETKKDKSHKGPKQSDKNRKNETKKDNTKQAEQVRGSGRYLRYKKENSGNKNQKRKPSGQIHKNSSKNLLRTNGGKYPRAAQSNGRSSKKRV